MLTSTFLLASLALLARATPTPTLTARQSITTLSTSSIDTFTPYAFFASAGYCNPSVTLTWTCGANCNANPGFIPTASGGDGAIEQFWFVGFDPALNSVVVSHQGTAVQDIIPDLEDADIIMTTLSPTLFPGLSSSIEAHSGFAGTQALSASSVLTAVEQTMSTHGTKMVTIVGHSLGGAIALLDSVFLPLHLPSTTTFKTVTFGLPRVGNQAFANYVDAHNPITHVNNKEDPVPILPGMFLGFHHPSGEVHIMDNNAWVSCPGQDNESTECTTGDVPTIFSANTTNHDGPYNGVEMGC